MPWPPVAAIGAAALEQLAVGVEPERSGLVPPQKLGKLGHGEGRDALVPRPLAEASMEAWSDDRSQARAMLVHLITDHPERGDDALAGRLVARGLTGG